jgi:hypothetical protein
MKENSLWIDALILAVLITTCGIRSFKDSGKVRLPVASPAPERYPSEVINQP